MYDHLRFHWHAGKLLAGSAQPGRYRLLKDDLETIRKKGIKTIISVNGDLTSIPPEFSKKLAFYSEPVTDGYPPSEEQMKRIVKIAQGDARRHRPILVCCRGGIGRTSTVLAVLLMELKGMTMEEALAELREVGRSPQSMDQHDFLSRWSDRLKKKRSPSSKE